MLLQNEHIRLRKVEPQDLPFLYLWENDTAEWGSGDTHNPLSQKDLRDYIERSTGDVYKDGQLRLIIETAEGTTAGCIDMYDFDPHNRRSAVGIYIDSAFRRKGIGQEAVRLLEEYAFCFLHVRMLYSFVAAANKKSAHFFASCAWQQVSTLPYWLQNSDVFVYQRITPLLQESVSREF